MTWVYIAQRIDDGRIVGVYRTRQQAERAHPAGVIKVVPWAVTQYDG